MSLRTLLCTVDDVPGVLNRVASLFRRRAFNIVSLTVGRTETSGVSRLTVVVDADDETAHRLEASLYKLVDVLDVRELAHTEAVARELALIKVRADQAMRAQVVQLVDLFRARVVHVGPEALVVEITGTRDKVDGLVAVLAPHGILEMTRTGEVAMSRAAAQNEETTWQRSTSIATVTSG